MSDHTCKGDCIFVFTFLFIRNWIIKIMQNDTMVHVIYFTWNIINNTWYKREIKRNLKDMLRVQNNYFRSKLLCALEVGELIFRIGQINVKSTNNSLWSLTNVEVFLTLFTPKCEAIFLLVAVTFHKINLLFLWYNWRRQHFFYYLIFSLKSNMWLQKTSRWFGVRGNNINFI